MKKPERTLLSDEATANYQGSLLHKETDRGCALIGGAMVDEALGDLLHALFNDTKGAWDSLLDGGMAPLKNFGARAQVANALGLVASYEYDDLVEVKWIRNRAAHVIGTQEEPFSFASQEVALRTKRLDHFNSTRMSPPPSAPSSRFHFTSAIIYLTIRILDRARHLREARTTGVDRGAALGGLIDDITRLGATPKVTTLMSWTSGDPTT